MTTSAPVLPVSARTYPPSAFPEIASDLFQRIHRQEYFASKQIIANIFGLFKRKQQQILSFLLF